ncbi:DUF411 domain-containing protein [Erythrobacter sp.]|uniref:DUF411 domain-containing protein n=1 Tax=Erythrobacter sp. TaxID=1042 RepID=UPI001425BFDE|nr:DUF411 domain-containing protein [Erythrobacter sp.]QIQ85857.1 MAG: DUF411 domain-containing protein [Erythrobacter sp.]
MKRPLLAPALLFLAACTSAAQAATYEMFRDPNCGCCGKWAEHVRAENAVEVAETITPDMAAVKTAKGVPQDLWSCHTLTVGDYVIEGHVPAAEIERLLAERPEGVVGLAVPGMPVGSPGMEMGNRTQPYEVIAFRADGSRYVFARYG